MEYGSAFLNVSEGAQLELQDPSSRGSLEFHEWGAGWSQPSRWRVPECLFATPSVWATTRLACFARRSQSAHWMKRVRGDTLTMGRPSRSSSSSQTVQERLQIHATPSRVMLDGQLLSWDVRTRDDYDALENPSVMWISPVIVKTTLGALVLWRR